MMKDTIAVKVMREYAVIEYCFHDGKNVGASQVFPQDLMCECITKLLTLHKIAASDVETKLFIIADD